MIACLCYDISYDEIEELIKSGKTLEEIILLCGAGSNCGACLKMIKQKIEERDRNK